MTGNSTHPYALEIQPGSKPETFQWVIRKGGKLLERSDRAFRSESDAQKNGAKALERLFADVQTTR